jgi:hypothetical protein
MLLVVSRGPNPLASLMKELSDTGTVIGCCSSIMLEVAVVMSL